MSRKLLTDIRADNEDDTSRAGSTYPYGVLKLLFKVGCGSDSQTIPITPIQSCMIHPCFCLVGLKYTI